MNEKIESTKYHPFFRKKVRDNLKGVFLPSKDD